MLLGADVLAAAAVRALPRRPGVVVVARGELPAPELGRGRRGGRRAGGACCRPTRRGCCRGRSRRCAPRWRGRLIAVGGACGGRGREHAGRRVAPWPRRRGALLVDADGWGGGLDLLLGRRTGRGAALAGPGGLRGRRVGGGAACAALPEVAGVAVLAASRSAPARAARRRWRRWSRRPAPAAGRSSSTCRGPGRTGCAAEAVLAEADLAVLVVPARVRAAAAAPVARGRRRPRPGRRRSSVVRRVPGGLVPRRWPTSSAGRCSPSWRTTGGRSPRGERGEPPPSPRDAARGAARRAVLGALPARGGGR